MDFQKADSHLSEIDPYPSDGLLQSGRRVGYRISEFRFHKPAVGQIVLPARSRPSLLHFNFLQSRVDNVHVGLDFRDRRRIQCAGRVKADASGRHFEPITFRLDPIKGKVRLSNAGRSYIPPAKLMISTTNSEAYRSATKRRC